MTCIPFRGEPAEAAESPRIRGVLSGLPREVRIGTAEVENGLLGQDGEDFGRWVCGRWENPRLSKRALGPL